MIVSPHCNKHDMAIRMLTLYHCERRNHIDCESGQCEHFGMRFYSTDGFGLEPLLIPQIIGIGIVVFLAFIVGWLFLIPAAAVVLLFYG